MFYFNICYIAKITKNPRKYFKTKSTVMFLFLLFFGLITAHASEKNIIVKVAILDQLMSQKLSSIIYKEDYLKGIKLASTVAKNRKHIDVIYKYFSYKKEPLGIFAAIPKVKAWKPDFIIGPRSSNSMLLLKNAFKNILVVSPMATSPQLETLPSNYYSFSLSDKYIAKALVIFTSKKLKNVPGILSVPAEDCISCKTISNLYLSKIKEQSKDINTIENYFTSDNVENIDISTILLGYEKDYIIFSPNISYVSGVLIARLLNSIKSNNVVFIGSDGWGSHDIVYVGKINAKYEFTAYYIQNWSIDIKTKEISKFDEDYERLFGEKTSYNVAYASYSTLNRILSLVNIKESRLLHNKNQYILNKFLLSIKNKKNLFKQKNYVIYKLGKEKDIPVAMINSKTWKLKDL